MMYALEIDCAARVLYTEKLCTIAAALSIEHIGTLRHQLVYIEGQSSQLSRNQRGRIRKNSTLPNVITELQFSNIIFKKMTSILAV